LTCTTESDQHQALNTDTLNMHSTVERFFKEIKTNSAIMHWSDQRWQQRDFVSTKKLHFK